MVFNASADSLALLVGLILSLVFSYVPGFADWYNAKNPDAKRAIMLVFIFLTTIVIFMLACFNVLTGVACTQQGFLALVQIFFAVLIANQTVDRISPKIGAKA